MASEAVDIKDEAGKEKLSSRKIVSIYQNAISQRVFVVDIFIHANGREHQSDDAHYESCEVSELYIKRNYLMGGIEHSFQHNSVMSTIVFK